MADNDKDRNPSYSNSMFGLGDSETQRVAPAGTPASSQPGTPQYVYQQAPPPAASGSAPSGQILLVLVAILLVISGVNLYLVITARQMFKDTTKERVAGLFASRNRKHDVIDGFFPASCAGRTIAPVSFVHLDVDVYQATIDSLVTNATIAEQSGRSSGPSARIKANIHVRDGSP